MKLRKMLLFDDALMLVEAKIEDVRMKAEAYASDFIEEHQASKKLSIALKLTKLLKRYTCMEELREEMIKVWGDSVDYYLDAHEKIWVEKRDREGRIIFSKHYP